MTTIHHLAIQRIKARRAEPIYTRGIAKFLKDIESKLELDFGVERFRRIPDAWSYVPDHRIDMPGTLNLFEVEDSHPISFDKLRDYAEFWHAFDFNDLDLRLFVYDRYAEQEREINLAEYFMMFVVDAAKRVA